MTKLQKSQKVCTSIIGNLYLTHKHKQPASQVTYQDLCQMIENPELTSKDQTSIIVPTDAQGKTKGLISKHNNMTSLWVDIDSGNKTLAELVSVAKGHGFLICAIYSTASANRPKVVKVDGIETEVLQGNRWRVIVPLASPMPCHAWLVLQKTLARIFGGGNEAVRIQQGFYAPTNPDNGYYEHMILSEGDLFDPDELPVMSQSDIDEIESKQIDLLKTASSAPENSSVARSVNGGIIGDGQRSIPAGRHISRSGV